MNRMLKTALQSIISLGLLYAAWRLAGGEAVIAQFHRLDVGWAAAAILLTIPQVMLSAERWRITVGRLGARLTYGRAVADYFLAGFVNQILPTGVMGDALRAWRHGRRDTGGEAPGVARAVRAVLYERASGQAVMLALVLTGAAAWPFFMPAAREAALNIWFGLALAGIALYPIAFLVRRVRPGWYGHAARFLAELGYAVFHRAVAARQLGLSLLVAASYLAVFYCAGRAIGVPLGLEVVLLVIPAVLLSMAAPVSIAGWGVRESVAALLWSAAGLAAAEGVAVSVAYGVLVLIGSLPGAVVLLSGR